jgi:hypothetical protein
MPGQQIGGVADGLAVTLEIADEIEKRLVRRAGPPR